MKLHIIDSGSSGNCYILETKRGEFLIIDAGVHFDKIKKVIGCQYNKVAACLITHEHQDHSKSASKVLDMAIKTMAPKEMISSYWAFGIPNVYAADKSYTLDYEFKIMPFEVKHDVPTVGYIIHHPECGQIVFATDTSNLNFIFPDTNHFIIEANYCMYALTERRMNGTANTYVSDRVEKTHLSIQKAVSMLKKNDLSSVQSITLIHLSDSNSHEGEFRDKVIEATGKPTYIAKKNMTIDLSMPW